MKRHGLSKKMHWFGTYMYAEYSHSTSTRTRNSTKYTCASITFCHVIDTVPAPSARNSNQNFSNVIQHEWGKNLSCMQCIKLSVEVPSKYILLMSKLCTKWSCTPAVTTMLVHLLIFILKNLWQIKGTVNKIKPVLEYNASADILSTYPLCFMISLPSLPPSPSLGAI